MKNRRVFRKSSKCHIAQGIIIGDPDWCAPLASPVPLRPHPCPDSVVPTEEAEACSHDLLVFSFGENSVITRINQTTRRMSGESWVNSLKMDSARKE